MAVVLRGWGRQLRLVVEHQREAAGGGLTGCAAVDGSHGSALEPEANAACSTAANHHVIHQADTDLTNVCFGPCPHQCNYGIGRNKVCFSRRRNDWAFCKVPYSPVDVDVASKHHTHPHFHLDFLVQGPRFCHTQIVMHHP